MRSMHEMLWPTSRKLVRNRQEVADIILGSGLNSGAIEGDIMIDIDGTVSFRVVDLKGKFKYKITIKADKNEDS